MNAIEVRDLRKAYGDVQAVNGVTFDVQAGECLALLGPNGAGKTTTTEVLEGYLHAECKSFVFRFVDDVDIVVDPVAHVYRFRSASRIGRSDLGVNRQRIARISARLALPTTTSN